MDLTLWITVMYFPCTYIQWKLQTFPIKEQTQKQKKKQKKKSKKSKEVKETDMSRRHQ